MAALSCTVGFTQLFNFLANACNVFKCATQHRGQPPQIYHVPCILTNLSVFTSVHCPLCMILGSSTEEQTVLLTVLQLILTTVLQLILVFLLSIMCTKVHMRYGNEKAAGSWIKAQLAHWLFHNGLSVLQVCLSQKTEEDLWHSRFYHFIRSSANQN